MSIREILVYPDHRLRRVAAPVERFDADLKQLVADMLETMYAADGIGLAAIQVDVPQRVIVMDLSEEKNQPRVFINPEITPHGDEVETEEGCLSVPETLVKVTRLDHADIRAQDVNGKSFEIAAEGMLAVCIQHEVDHLDGKVIVDYMSRLKRERATKKMQKARAESQAA